ncbi:PHD finger protein MALE STERILITY 1 [Impatiens glandulifera]|uniref:PHD finger protein MALE STERILITY 1 n=1 Tax=Impatiens glandulifera TaxID=253017 RepID=UPI001FB147DE|nr:PHD finger protein MALE STERILITY 1 [Impatiens glandulifera]
MSHLDLGGCKKRKRGERVFKFKSFGGQGSPVEWTGSFWENVKALLEFGHLERDLCCGGMSCWSFQLEVHRHPPLSVLLFVVEEPVEESLHRHCKYCRYVGWGQHMICNKKYHFLVPCKDSYGAGDSKGKFNLIELNGHILHGIFHSNGFGHLLCINGYESGSELPGYKIMDFWDRLCTGLHARDVSVNDNSQKRGMDTRLLHGVAYGEPWFGQWGYRFGRGCYGVTQVVYQKAIETLRNMPFALLFHHYGSTICNHEISVILSRYQSISGYSLMTLGDLLHFMFELRYQVPKENHIASSYNPRVLVESACRWSQKRVEMATRVIVEALKKAEFKWVSRQEVRDAARAYIGDTGLLDFVLKSLGNHVVGNYLVHRSLNPVTKVLEYCLEDITNAFPNQEGDNSDMNKLTKVQLMKDMFYLYTHILVEHKPITMTMDVIPTIPLASRIILDTKYFIKVYNDEASKAGFTGDSKIYCTVALSNKNSTMIEVGPKTISPPCECFTLDNTTSFNDLRVLVEERFKEMYLGLKGIELGLEAKGSDLVLEKFSNQLGGRTLIFDASNHMERGKEVHEDTFEGSQNVIVHCLCGATDDDGERMVCCDVCEVWQHTRCVRIPNDQQVPNVFLCTRCEHEILLFPSIP